MATSRRSSPAVFALAAVALLMTCVAGGSLLLLFLGRGGNAVGGGPAPGPRPEPVLVTPRGDLSEAEQSTVELFRNAAPSVVYITTLSVRSDRFRRNVYEVPEGTGSGFVWDRQGHIVTNFHVIRNAQAAQVTFADQSVYRAELVGYVAEKDLAVLRIPVDADSLVPLPVGESEDLQVGQHVFAIGNPFGFDHTLSTGVISGLDREITSVTQRPITGMVQTDAAINPGNSGGPLLDSAGRLIGVNTAIYSPSGAYAGIGFAVPVDTVRRIVPQLIEHGRVVRPGLGIRLAPPQLLARLRIEGVLVFGVEEGGPAARAGLQPTRQDLRTGDLLLGDIIVGAGGEPIRTNNDLFRVLDRADVGDTLELRIERGGQERTVTVTLAGYEAE